MFQFIPSFIKRGADYAVLTLEAITMAVDVFPPLKFKLSGKDAKTFASDFQQTIACIINSVVKNGDSKKYRKRGVLFFGSAVLEIYQNLKNCQQATNSRSMITEFPHLAIPCGTQDMAVLCPFCP